MKQAINANTIIKYYCMACLFMVCNVTVKGAVPDWAVEVSNYEYSMTVTAVLEVDEAPSRDENDLLAAFVNGEVRGVSRPDVYVSSSDTYMAFMTIYGNSPEDKITFKYYDASEDLEVEANNLPLDFIIDGRYGSTGDPLVISENASTSIISLDHQEVAENQPAQTLVGRLSSTSKILGTSISFSLPNSALDNEFFSITQDRLYTATVLDKEQRGSYEIEIAMDNGLGQVDLETFTITVADLNEAPTITPQSFSITEGLVTEGSIGTIVATDPDEEAVLSFMLLTSTDIFDVSPEGEIILLEPSSIDFETEASFSLLVEVTDGEWSNEAAMTINIEDNAEEGLAFNNYVSPNQDGFNDTWRIQGLATLGTVDVMIYDRNGKVVYQQASYDNEWQGQNDQGDRLATGIYFFVLKSGNQSYKGSIQLVR